MTAHFCKKMFFLHMVKSCILYALSNRIFSYFHIMVAMRSCIYFFFFLAAWKSKLISTFMLIVI